MKKESSGKKSKLGLIIAIILAVVLLAGGAVAGFLLLGGGEEAPGAEEKLESKLYWNMDRLSMLSPDTGLSRRTAEADGMYYVRFAVEGEYIEVPFADRKLVHEVDTADLWCLKFDNDGIAIDVVDPQEVYVRLFDKVTVQSIDGNTVMTNSSMLLNGMKKPLTLTDDMAISNMSTRVGDTQVGQADELEVFDQIVVYGTDENTPTDVFITDRYWESEIYWSPAARAYYNTTTKMSTRPLNDDGYWYIDLVCKGETKTYRTAMQDVINVLDGKGPTDAATGVVFNEQGDIINLFNAGYACRGVLSANSYDITDISEDGKTFTATRVMFGTEIGKTFTGNVTEDTQVYNMTSTADIFGEPTTLQKDDRLLVYTKADGSIHTIFVVNRMVDSPFYYNLSRKWSSVDGLTRTPNEDGYYVYELAVNGKVKTVRTKDRAIAEKMDGMNLAVFGLKLKGDIVVKVYDAVNVAGNWSFASNYFVTSLEGGILGTVSTTGTAANGVLSADCKVYDVSQCYKEFRGEKTTLREGDQILAYQNAFGEVTHVWVLNRYVKGTTIYWNCNRYYANGETTRTPDADGYYVFNVIKAGTTKVIQLKTKDKEVANRFDKEGSTTAAALKVKGDIIQAAYPAPAAIGGYYRLSGFWVHQLNVDENNPNVYALIARTGAIGNITLADDCKVMNFSQITKKAAGELTTLKAGDYVWPIAGQDGLIHYVFIIEREVPGSKLAWRKNTLATLKDADGKVMQDKDGNNMLVADANGYYVFDLWVNGKIGTYKTKDLKLANYVNTRATGFSVSVKGNTITGAYPISSQPDTRAASVSYYDYVKISDGVMTLKRNRIGQTDTGAEMTVPVASNYKAYNFDPASGADWGKQVKLNKGDRVYAYSNNDGESYIFFVMYRCTLSGGNERMCNHCGKKVHWESIFAGYGPAAGCAPKVAHYYLPVDYEGTGWTLGNAVQQTEGVSTEIVFDLNGKTLTRKGTLNTTDGIKYAPGAALTAGYGNTLRIVDYSKGNTGKVVSAADALYNGAGSLLHVQAGSKLIVEEGLIDGSKGTVNYTGANGGTISVGGELVINGGTIYGRASNGSGSVIGAWGGTSVTINGGTLIGNTVNGAVNGTGYGGVIATNGNLTINGGTIKGGSASAGGDNIYVGNANAVVTIKGGTIDGGVQIAAAKSVKLSGKPQIAAGKNYGLKLPANLKIDATGLKTGAKVYVDASGVFTTDFASAAAAQAVIDNGMLKAGAEGMMLKVDGKAIASVADGVLRTWTDSTKLPEMGRWELGVDVTISSRVDVSSDLYIDLNGHDITRTVASDATTGCQVIRVTSGKLTIDDTSSAGDGTVSVAYADGQAINDYSAVIHVTDQGEMTLEGGIIDGSNVDNLYTPASNGTISVGGKLTVNGGIIKGVKRGSSNGGAIGAWAGSSITVNGGEIYAGGSFLNGTTQKVNGAAIATTGNLTINGGKIIGPGASSTAEERARSGGLIYANGDSLYILGGELIDGFGTGYGFNVYYERNYLALADKDGKRAQITGGGEVVIGGDAFVKGGVTIRSSKADDTVKLTVKDTAVIDSAGAVAATNIRLYNGALYINDSTTAATTAPENANYDISMIYTCQNVPTGFQTGNTTKYEHTYGDDAFCDDCGYDKNTPVAWTDKTKLPTSGNYYLDVDVETSATTTMAGDLYLDLKGHTITHKAANDVIKTGANKLTITDTSTNKDGKITTTTLSGNITSMIYVQAGGELILEAGTIDASNITNSYTAANAGAITIGNGNVGGVSVYGKATINGGTVKGWKSSGNGSAIGMMNLTTLIINDGTIIGNTVTKSINGTGYGGAIMANGHLTINGGNIHGGTAASGGDNIFVNNASANVTITGGEIDGGVQLNAYASFKAIGTVKVGEGASYGLKIPAGKTVDLTGLTGGKIYVDADGVFTTAFTDNAAATAALAFVEPGDSGKTLSADGNVLKLAAQLELTLSKTTLTLEEGKDETITATAVPATATITWTSSDETVATVVNGKITALKPGTATITVKAAHNGLEVTKTCTVTVKSKATIAEQDWVNWDATADAAFATKLPTAGKYKLTSNVTISASVTMTGDLWLDLNGFTVTMTGSSFAIGTNGNNLLIDDLSGKTGDELGTIRTTATAINARAAVIYVSAVANKPGSFTLNNGILDGTTATNAQTNLVSGTVTVGNATGAFPTFTMNGGVIKGQKCSVMTSGVGGSAIGLMNSTHFVMNGGTIYAHSYTSKTANVCCTGSCINAGGASGTNPTSTITINGGTMYAGRAQNHGAAIYTAGNVYMNGGTIYGSQSQNSGAICSNGGAELVITGGTIIGGNTVANPGNGSAIDKAGGVLTIGGNAVIGGGVNIRSSAKMVLKGSPIINAMLGAEQKFDVRINGGSVYLNDTTGTAIQTANGNYKLTYDANGVVNGLAAYAAVTVTEGTTIPTAGAVKLTGPVTLTAPIVTTGDLYIDLNGQTVTNTGTNFAIQAKHNVVITDSSAAKTGKIVTSTASFNASAAVLKIENGKHAILVAGTLDGSAVTNAFNTGYAGTVTVGNYATFNMLGGEVKGQISASTGSTGVGGSCVGGWANSTIIINGGKLTAPSKGTTFPTHAVAAQGTCISSGGNVFVHGGELQGTMATNHGANIYCTGNLTITGGLISGGYANNSGLINCSGASLTITGGTLVGGTAHSGSALGGASIDYAKDGGVLTIGGNAKIAGGVSIRSKAKLVLTGKAVIDMNMAGQTQKKFNIQIKNGPCTIWLNEATGTALANASSGMWDVKYDAAGNIIGITAK